MLILKENNSEEKEGQNVHQTAIERQIDKTTKDKLTKDKLSKDKSTKDKSTGDKSTKDKLTNDNSTKDNLTKVNPTKDKSKKRQIDKSDDKVTTRIADTELQRGGTRVRKYAPLR